MAVRRLNRTEGAKLVGLVAAYRAVDVLQGFVAAPVYKPLIGLVIVQYIVGIGIESRLTVIRRERSNILKVSMFGLLYVVPSIAVMAGRFPEWAIMFPIVGFAAVLIRVGLAIGASTR